MFAAKSGPKSLCLCCFFFRELCSSKHLSADPFCKSPIVYLVVRWLGYGVLLEGGCLGKGFFVFHTGNHENNEMKFRKQHPFSILGPAPLQKCVGDFCRVNFGGFCRGFSGTIFLGTFSHKNEEKTSGDKIRKEIRRPKHKNPRKIRSAKNRLTIL